MKKFIILAVTAIILIACTDHSQTKEQTFESGNNPTMSVEFTYKGHKYIYFEMYNGGYDRGSGYVHDPECEKQDNGKKVQQRDL